MACILRLNGYEMENLSKPIPNIIQTIILHWRIGMHLPEISILLNKFPLATKSLRHKEAHRRF